MTGRRPPRRLLDFALAGASPALADCGDFILARGHNVRHVAARSDSVAAWARRRGLDVSRPAGAGDLASLPAVDHVVSVGNDLILSPAALARARRSALNLHNSRLPAYRGAFATSWAILAGETMHGVTWHVMEPAIDAGPPIAARDVPILADDTAHSLNARCMSAGVDLFRERVLPLLECGEPAQERLAARPYHPVARRAPALGLVDWRLPAAEVARAVRALDRGPVDNSFDLAKLLTARGCWAVSQPEELPHLRLRPGMLELEEDGALLLGTATCAVRLRTWAACDPRAAGQAPGALALGLPSASQARVAEELGAAAARRENENCIRWARTAGAPGAFPDDALREAERAPDWFAAARWLIRHLRRSGVDGPVRIALRTPSMSAGARALAPLFAADQPFLLDPAEEPAPLAERLAAADAAGPVLADVWLRRRALRDLTPSHTLVHLRCAEAPRAARARDDMPRQAGPRPREETACGHSA